MCYQCVATVSLMPNLPTPHADKFSTLSLASSCRSVRIDLAIAIVPTAAGLLTMPFWCGLCRKALAPSAPPRCTCRCLHVGHNTTFPNQGCGQVTHSVHFRYRAMGPTMPFLRLSSAMSLKPASVVRTRSVVTGTTVFAAANAQMDTTRYLAIARGAVQMLSRLLSSLCLYCPGCYLSHSLNGKP